MTSFSKKDRNISNCMVCEITRTSGIYRYLAQRSMEFLNFCEMCPCEYSRTSGNHGNQGN